eukprot:2736684-Pleurochrysis_carterae.AAC.4
MVHFHTHSHIHQHQTPAPTPQAFAHPHPSPHPTRAPQTSRPSHLPEYNYDPIILRPQPSTRAPHLHPTLYPDLTPVARQLNPHAHPISPSTPTLHTQAGYPPPVLLRLTPPLAPSAPPSAK